MKRGAEKQLSKDDDRDDEVEVCRVISNSKAVPKHDPYQETQSGIQIAKESELAKREIRGLPKRRSPAVTPGIPPASTTTPAVPQRFGSFSGFGAPGGAATPFTFAPSPLAAPQKPVDAPAVSESASSATKKFASFLGPSSTVGAKPVRSSSSETAKPDASGDTDEVALKYYTSLRGLNSSFLSAVSKAIESDPFFDVADILEQYKKHRISVQQDYDGKSSPAKTQSAPSPPSKPSMPAAPFSFLKPATSTPATMPAPPSSFASFAAPSNSATPATGFTPSPAAPTTEPSPFGFSSRSASSDPKSASSASSAPFSSLASGTSSSSLFKPPGSREAESDSLKPAFPVGAFASAGPTSGASPFGSGGSLSSSTSLFGNPPKTSTLFSSDKAAQEEKDKEKDKAASSVLAPATFSFSLPTTTKLFSDTSSGSSSIFGASTTTKSAEEKEKEKEKGLPSLPPPSSIFGGTFGSSPAKPSPFAFVVPGGSEGSSPPRAGSVGFSFGSPTRAGSQTAATTTTAPSSVFGLASMPASSSASASAATPPGAPGAGTAGSTPASTTASTPTPAVPATSSLLDVPSSAAASRGDTPATEGSVEEDGLARTMSPGLHGGEGEGEEDEETTYTVKSKVYKFTTDREGVPTWSEMGIGMLRLKKHKETNARRVILRSSTTGKIIIVRCVAILSTTIFGDLM
ncbi:hypothetical protein BC826DRAFT_967791 [Russula brevipes]|nr:hypothetical protein BC826DRAFT_967791 [Russula brevipes]